MIKHLLLFFLFFSFPLFACSGIYTSCVSKVKDAHVIQGNKLFIPILKHLRLVYSRTKPTQKILKYDSFLSLYLIEDNTSFPYPFEMDMLKKLPTSLITQKSSCHGYVIQHQVGLNHLGKYSVTSSKPALITNGCCVLEALALPQGMIEKPYIRHFLSTKNKHVSYGDIGIRIRQEGKNSIILRRDPYFKNNPFKKGDFIISFDGKKYLHASRVMQKILLSKVGSPHRVQIKRGRKFYTYTLTTQKRYGGGSISDTFLERYGVTFDTTLHIKYLSKNFQKYGLKIGDKLLEIDKKNLKKLLFERNHFQFFVHIQ